MANLFDLTDKTAIVTGGGRGLGQAMAIGLAEAGARVIVAGRTIAGLEETAEAIKNAGGQADIHQFEATDFEQCEKLVSDTVATYGRLDILVTSHGIGTGAPAEMIPEDMWRQLIDVDLTSTFSCAQAAGKQMLEQEGGGSIIMISSTSSMVAFAGGAAYGAAKAGVDHLCRSMAFEWAERGVRVNIVSPGFMSSHMRGTEEYYNDETYKKWVTDRTPMGREGAPEELVGPLVFLASDAASFVTGHIIPVDGGWMTGQR